MTSLRTPVSDVATSVTVLRERGSLSLREVTRETAKRMGCVLEYADVDAVLRREMDRGLVRIGNTVVDYRDCMWEAM